MLDIPTAETCFRRALKIAKRSGGSHSYTARLASSALGELLYERGDLDEADRLLEEGYKLGPEGGSVDFKIARYVIAARIKALRGDRHAAGQRLDEAARVARTLSLKRLRAMAEHERTRLGLPPHPDSDPWLVTSYTTRRTPVDAIDEITVQFEEASAIRVLIDATRHFLDQLILAKGARQGRLGDRRLWRAIERTAIQHGCEKTFHAQPPGRVLGQGMSALWTDRDGWQIRHQSLISIVVQKKIHRNLSRILRSSPPGQSLNAASR
jgi:tetratricopeptide (TPR) repeat protein